MMLDMISAPTFKWTGDFFDWATLCTMPIGVLGLTGYCFNQHFLNKSFWQKTAAVILVIDVLLRLIYLFTDISFWRYLFAEHRHWIEFTLLFTFLTPYYRALVMYARHHPIEN